MTTADDTLMQSLRNAHAMEKQAIESTENQIDRLQNYPELQGWVRDHVEASRRQRERVRTPVSNAAATTPRASRISLCR